MAINLALLRSIVKGVEAGRIPVSTARRAMGGSEEGTQAFQILTGLSSPGGMDIFGQNRALARIPGRSYEVPDLGVPTGPSRVAGLPEIRVSERPSAIVPSPAGAVDYPGYVRRTAQELLNEQLGALPGGPRTFGVQAVDVREIPAAGRGFPSQPNVSRAIPVGSAAAEPRAAAPYRMQPSIDEVEAALRGGPLVRYQQPRTDIVPTGVVLEDLTRYPQSALPGGFRTPYPDRMAPNAGFEPGTIPFSEEAIRNALVRGAENALVGGVQTGNLKDILKAGGISLAAGLGAGLLGKLFGMGRPTEKPSSQSQTPLAGTVPQIQPPGTITAPNQTTGGVEAAPESPAPRSPAGQVVLTMQGDQDEALKEQIQQYTGEKMRTAKPGGREVKYPNELARAYADQIEYGRQNMDMIVDRLGLTGNMEVWARTNPGLAARLLFQTEVKRMKQTDANQRTTFPSPLETQPRGLSQQSPTVQAQMVNTSLGADFERNRIGSIAFNTQTVTAPSQGTFDLAQSVTPLVQPTLVNPDQYQLQSEARQSQLRDLIFQQFGAV